MLLECKNPARFVQDKMMLALSLVGVVAMFPINKLHIINDPVIASNCLKGVAEMLQYYQTIRGWNQIELSNNLGMGISTIRNLLRGRTKLSIASAEKLARTFGTTENFWLKLDS